MLQSLACLFLKQNVNGKTYAVGGLVVAVRLDIHAYCLHRRKSEEGEALLLDFGTFQVVYLWRRPTEAGCHELLTQLMSWLVLASKRNKHLLSIGDWNLVPTENPLHMAGLHVHAVQDASDSRFFPSRWTGVRCVDYVVSDVASGPLSYQYSSYKLNDHKMLQVQMGFAFFRDVMYRLRPCVVYTCPEECRLSDWKQTLKRLCNEVDVHAVAPGNTELEWEWFNRIAANIFDRAADIHGVDCCLQDWAQEQRHFTANCC